LKRESKIGLGQELTIASYREIAIGISRRFLRRSTAFTAEEGDENEEWNEENRESLIAVEQAGHTAHIAGMIYARGVMEQAGVVAEKRQQFRASSIEWHRFLGFRDAENDVKSSRKRKRAPSEREAGEARMDRWGRLRKMDTTAQLKRMMSKTAEFRGVQQEAMDAIVAGESPVVAVMPTGGGKSLWFILPAWAEQGGTTVVVIPLIALRGDMIRRCKSLGISYAAWEGRRPPDAAAIVLVTPTIRRFPGEVECLIAEDAQPKRAYCFLELQVAGITGTTYNKRPLRPSPRTSPRQEGSPSLVQTNPIVAYDRDRS
jgi:hypothetical protein